MQAGAALTKAWPGVEGEMAGCEDWGLCRTLAKSFRGTAPFFCRKVALRTGGKFIDLPLEGEAVLGSTA